VPVAVEVTGPDQPAKLSSLHGCIPDVDELDGFWPQTASQFVARDSSHELFDGSARRAESVFEVLHGGMMRVSPHPGLVPAPFALSAIAAMGAAAPDALCCREPPAFADLKSASAAYRTVESTAVLVATPSN